MNLVTSRWKAVGSAVILSLVTTCAGAALRYTLEIETVEEDKTTRVVERTTLDGDRARIEYFEGEPTLAQPVVVMLTVNGGKTWVLSGKTYAECGEWDMATFYQNAGSLITKAESWVNAKVMEAQIETLSREPGPDILGYPTTHVRLHTTMHSKAKLLFMEYEYRIEITDDIWFSPSVGLHPIEKRWLDAIAHTDYEKLDRLTQAAIDEIGGTILKQETVAHLHNVRKNKEETKIQNFTVTAIEKLSASDLPKGTFEVPKCEPVDKASMDEKAKEFFNGLGFAY